tara:strand:+ start:150 stop:923 length:774 start_codon:yes stop_codon:yes gene_type:complete
MNCAIYIDADNVSYKSIEEIISNSYNSNVIIKKIFADWTHDSMHKWAKKARQYGFQGIQCFGNEKKQTSDIYMITDIINDLYNNPHIEMIILATSDIDFTHLCHLIKSKNKKLVIFTPQKSSITNLVEVEENTEQELSIPNKKNKKKPLNDNLNYLEDAMGDNIFLYISEFKKNLKKIVPIKNKSMDINHIDKELIKYPKNFGLIKKGKKIKVVGLFHLLKYSKDDFIKKKLEIESEYYEIFKIYDYNKLTNILYLT